MSKLSINTAILIFLGVIMLTTNLFAQLAGNPENLCRNGFFPRESRAYSLAVVKGAKNEKVYFYGDARADCPNGKNCRLKSYVVPNDEVIVSRRFGGFACAWFQPAQGSETVGWLPLKNLDSRETPVSTDAAWVGEWRFYDNMIDIGATAVENTYKINGTAFWKGLGDNIHIGELDGAAKLRAAKLIYGDDGANDDDCRVEMILVGRFLIVSDNLSCGGANVTFAGVYRKNSKK